MNDKETELLRIAKKVGIPPEQVIRWNYLESPLYISRNPGRPKGKILRPKGCLSIGEIRAKYRLTTKQVRALREAGMPTMNVGTLIAIHEADLKIWVQSHSQLLKEKW